MGDSFATAAQRGRVSLRSALKEVPVLRRRHNAVAFALPANLQRVSSASAAFGSV
jgi:hypothetical protein